MSERRISTEQVRRTGDIAAIAAVERLDRIIELLEAESSPVLAVVSPATPRAKAGGASS